MSAQPSRRSRHFSGITACAVGPDVDQHQVQVGHPALGQRGDHPRVGLHGDLAVVPLVDSEVGRDAGNVVERDAPRRRPRRSRQARRSPRRPCCPPGPTAPTASAGRSGRPPARPAPSALAGSSSVMEANRRLGVRSTGRPQGGAWCGGTLRCSASRADVGTRTNSSGRWCNGPLTERPGAGSPVDPNVTTVAFAGQFGRERRHSSRHFGSLAPNGRRGLQRSELRR